MLSVSEKLLVRAEPNNYLFSYLNYFFNNKLNPVSCAILHYHYVKIIFVYIALLFRSSAFANYVDARTIEY